MWDHKWEELWHCGAPEVYSLYQRCTFTDFCPSDHNDLTAEGMRACLYDKQEHFLINHGKTLSPLLTTHPVHHLSSLWQWTEISDNPPHLWFVLSSFFQRAGRLGWELVQSFQPWGQSTSSGQQFCLPSLVPILPHGWVNCLSYSDSKRPILLHTGLQEGSTSHDNTRNRSNSQQPKIFDFFSLKENHGKLFRLPPAIMTSRNSMGSLS